LWVEPDIFFVELVPTNLAAGDSFGRHVNRSSISAVDLRQIHQKNYKWKHSVCLCTGKFINNTSGNNLFVFEWANSSKSLQVETIFLFVNGQILKKINHVEISFYVGMGKFIKKFTTLK
jgi:hypothetical protein